MVRMTEGGIYFEIMRSKGEVSLGVSKGKYG